MTPGTPPTHEPWAPDCCLACYDALGGEGLYPIACVHCHSLRCLHATNHTLECSTKAGVRFTAPRPRRETTRRFQLGELLRRS